MLTDTTSSTPHPSTSLRLPPVSTRPPSRTWNAFSLLSQILSSPTCQSPQCKVGSIDRPLPLPSQISVIPDTWFNATKCCSSGFLSRSQLSHAALILICSFLVLPAPASRFCALVLAQMTDGPPRSTSSCASASLCQSLVIHILRPCHAFFIIPFNAVNIYSN